MSAKAYIGIRPEAEYVRLEYIESTGTQYIDTGIKGNGSTKVELIYQYYALGSTVSGSGRIFGSRTSTSSNALWLGSQTGNLSESTTYVFGYNNTYKALTNFAIDSDVHTFYFDNLSFKIDGVDYGSFKAATFTTPENLKIFGFDNGGVMGCGVGRCDSCKIWDDTTLIRDYVPHKRKSDGAVGLLDKANNVFYTNAGTGEFIAGPEVGEVLYDPTARLIRNIFIGIGPDTGKRLYNGVELPSMPENDNPYACILKDGDGYSLYLTDKEVVYADGVKFPNETSAEIYTANSGDSDWYLDRTTAVAAGTVLDTDIVWTNYDIYTESTSVDVIFENGILYIKSAEAVLNGNTLEVK